MACSEVEHVGEQLLRDVYVYDVDTLEPTDPGDATFTLTDIDGNQRSWSLADPDVTIPATGTVRLVVPDAWTPADVGSWELVAIITNGSRLEVVVELFDVVGVRQPAA